MGLLALLLLFSLNHGQSNEGNEGHEGHESYEGNEEEVCQQDRKGPLRQGRGLPWNQGKDHWWLDQGRLGQEQEWQDREQEELGSWQEGLLQHQDLDCRRPEGKEGTRPQGLRRDQEGHTFLQEGQGVLPVKMLIKGFSSGCGDVYALRAL